MAPRKLSSIARQQLLKTLLLSKRHERGYSMPMVMVIALVLILGSLALASRSGQGLLSAIFQNQSWEAREAAEIGMQEVISELNREQNRYLMVQRSSDSDGIWVASSDAATIARRTNPCSGTTAPRYNYLDPRESAAEDTTYGTWYIQDDGSITSSQGTARRGFQLVGVDRQTLSSDNSELNLYRNRPDGTGEITLEVKGLVFRNTNQVASATLEKAFELVPKCCKVSFGGAHGGLDYGINDDDESICLNSPAALGFGLIAGAGRAGGSMSLIGTTTVEDGFEDSSIDVSPVICIVAPGTTCEKDGNTDTAVAQIDATLPAVKTYADAFNAAPSDKRGSSSITSGSLLDCTATNSTSTTGPIDNIRNSSISGSTISAAKNTTYSNVRASGGTGTGARFTVRRNNRGGIQSVTIENAGSGYTAGDTLTISGASVGGTSPGANISFTISSITATTSQANNCPSNSTGTQEETDLINRLTNFTYCADDTLSSCSVTVINGGVSSANLPANCVINSADTELHCNISELTYDNMVIATGTRKVFLYFTSDDPDNRRNDFVVEPARGTSQIKHCKLSAADLASAADASDCTSASGADIARVAMFGCATTVCTTQTVELQGNAENVGMFTYFPVGDMQLNGTPTYSGVMWGKTIDAVGTSNFVIPAAGLIAVYELMGMALSDEDNGTTTYGFLYFDFVARSTNRYRWK